MNIQQKRASIAHILLICIFAYMHILENLDDFVSSQSPYHIIYLYCFSGPCRIAVSLLLIAELFWWSRRSGEDQCILGNH